jgi:hypothetical protein
MGSFRDGVPALTFGVLTNLALANFLASRSFGNVSVTLACARGFSGSNETHHVPLDLPAIMRRSRGYAGGSPSATSPNFSEFWVTPSVTSGTSINREPDSFPAIQSLPPAGAQEFREVLVLRRLTGAKRRSPTTTELHRSL